MKTVIKKVLLWMVSVFCILFALAFCPSISSILFLIVAVGCMPLKVIDRLWDKIPLKSKLIKPILFTVLFIIAIGVTPTPAGSTETEEAVLEGVSEGENESVNDITDDIDVSEEVAEDNAEKLDAVQSQVKEERQANTETEKAAEEKMPENVSEVSFDLSTVPAYSGKPYIAINDNIPYFTEVDVKDAANSYEKYAPLDNQGRCGTCVASVGTDIMPTEERGEIGQIKPSGWKQVKYAGKVDGNYLYNRCHLIGYQLTGENANEKNLITGTRYINTEGMLPFENMVADYVKETKNHVLYRVTPIFDGNNPLASGVLMEAESVEDGGDGILFNVFCYNVQPGIVIDYATGDSHEEAVTVSEEKQTTDSEITASADSTEVQASDTQEQQQETVQEQSQTPTATGGFAVNNNNGKIHIVGKCSATGTGEGAMKHPSYFNTYEEAEAYSIQIAPSQDKRKCGNCWK